MMAGFFVLLLSTIAAFCPNECFGENCNSPCYSLCLISCEDFCSENCLFSMINDGTCQTACNKETCGFDGADCKKKRRGLTSIEIANTTLIAESAVIAEDNYGKIAGVGLGVFLTIIAIIIGVILCIIGMATPVFFIFLLIGLLLPIITFLIVALAPLHKDQTVKKDTRTDDYITARILLLITMIVFALIAFFKVFEYYLGINLKAKGVNSNIVSTNPSAVLAPASGNNGENGDPPENPPQNPLLGPQGPSPPPNPFLSGISRSNLLQNLPPPDPDLRPLRQTDSNPFGRYPQNNPLSPHSN